MNNKGFTLVEMLIATVLITLMAGLLLTIFLPLLNTFARNQSRAESAFIGATIRDYIKDQLVFAEEIYFSDSLIGEEQVGEYNQMVCNSSGRLTVNDEIIFGDGFYFNRGVSYVINRTENNTISMTLIVANKGITEFTDSFLITNINMSARGNTLESIHHDVSNGYIYYR